MGTEISSVPYLGTLRVMLIPRNATGTITKHMPFSMAMNYIMFKRIELADFLDHLIFLQDE